MYLFLFTLTLCVRGGACGGADVAGGGAGGAHAHAHGHGERARRGDDPVTVIEPELYMSGDNSASKEDTEDNMNKDEDSKDDGIEIPTSSAASAERGGGVCAYRPPGGAQVAAMISDMVNQLTRVFVRMQNHVRSARPGGGGGGGGGGGHEKRYRLVARKDEEFFETIFANMTQEFRELLNETTSKMGRAGRDPCRHQPEMKQLWRALLDAAQSSYWKAALRCVDELMLLQAQARGPAPPSSPQAPEPAEPARRRRAGEAVLRALAPPRSLRTALLSALCDRFRLCYYELL